MSAFERGGAVERTLQTGRPRLTTTGAATLLRELFGVDADDDRGRDPAP
jgi:hypothetical protein